MRWKSIGSSRECTELGENMKVWDNKKRILQPVQSGHESIKPDFASV